MKGYIFVLVAAVSFAACDKPTETTVPAEATQKPVEAPKVEQPAPSAENSPGDTAAAVMPADLKSGEKSFHGAKFTVIEPPITLAKAIAQASEHPSTVKVEAAVAAVCKKKGCWFTMTGEGVEADVRVRMKDYSFFVPKNSESARVIAEGTLAQREVPQEEAQHYADDAAKAGEEPAKVGSAQKVWEFTATAVELQAAES